MRKVLIFVLLVSMSIGVAADDYVTDVLGRKISTAPTAKRIVALSPHIVENLFSAGAGGGIVGAVDYSDYPERAKMIPRVGSATHFSLETLVSLQPDLVIIWHSGRGGQVLSKLLSLGMRVYASDPVTMSDITKEILDYGKLTGNKVSANQQVQAFEQELHLLKRQFSQRSTVTTFYQVWNDPIQTINGKHLISDVISLCGGKNVFANAHSIAPIVNMESILQRNPEVIVASGMDTARPEWLDAWQQWPMLQATKSNNLFFIPPDHIQRHTLRVQLGARQFCDYLQQARNKKANTHRAATQKK